MAEIQEMTIFEEPGLKQEASADMHTGVAEEGHADETGVLGSLGLNPQLFAWQLFNFLVVFLIVWYLILRPLTKKMEERRVIIDESLDKAKEIETKLGMADVTYAAKLDEAKKDADAIIARAHEEATSLSERMKQESREEIAMLVSKAKQKIQEEKEQTLQQIRAEAASIAVMVAEKILEEKIDTKKDKQLIESALSQIKK